MLFKLLFAIFLFGVSIIQGCKYFSEDNVSLQGSYANLAEKKLHLYQILPASKPLIDSVTTDASGNFSISFPVKTTGYYTLQLNQGNDIILIVSPNEEITLEGDGHTFRNSYKINGSKDSEIYAIYHNFTQDNLQKVDSLSRFFAENRSNPDFQSIRTRLDSAYLAVFNDQKGKVISFVNNHLNSLASLLVISNNFGPNPVVSEQTHPELFLKLDSTLFQAYPENSLVNAFHLRMLAFKAKLADINEQENLLKPGMPAPPVNLNDASGEEVKLSFFRGKLTLLYFWSSWNAVCRQTNMKLSSIYTQYHDRGFEIFAVSIDSDADLWKKAYMLDKAYWIQVNDPKGLESEYCKTYSVRAIPKMILIGKDGNIIVNNPGLIELETMIKENI